jgi:hypothetical protein
MAQFYPERMATKVSGLALNARVVVVLDGSRWTHQDLCNLGNIRTGDFCAVVCQQDRLDYFKGSHVIEPATDHLRRIKEQEQLSSRKHSSLLQPTMLLPIEIVKFLGRNWKSACHPLITDGRQLEMSTCRSCLLHIYNSSQLSYFVMRESFAANHYFIGMQSCKNHWSDAFPSE